MDEKLDQILELLSEIRSEIGLCCMSHMDPDYVEERLDKIEELLDGLS